jgi:isopenicillin N synthase-like dioxygenase
VKGHGLTDQDVRNQYAIARDLFQLPLKEKLKYLASTEVGDFRGYKAQATGELASIDNDERYNIPKFTPEHDRPHPDLILKHFEEIKKFSLVGVPRDNASSRSADGICM